MGIPDIRTLTETDLNGAVLFPGFAPRHLKVYDEATTFDLDEPHYLADLRQRRGDATTRLLPTEPEFKDVVNRFLTCGYILPDVDLSAEDIIRQVNGWIAIENWFKGNREFANAFKQWESKYGSIGQTQRAITVYKADDLAQQISTFFGNTDEFVQNYLVQRRSELADGRKSNGSGNQLQENQKIISHPNHRQANINQALQIRLTRNGLIQPSMIDTFAAQAPFVMEEVRRKMKPVLVHMPVHQAEEILRDTLRQQFSNRVQQLLYISNAYPGNFLVNMLSPSTFEIDGAFADVADYGEVLEIKRRNFFDQLGLSVDLPWIHPFNARLAATSIIEAIQTGSFFVLNLNQIPTQLL